MVSNLDDDGNPASVDAVLSAPIECGMRRIKDVVQRLNITVAIVQPKFMVEQRCHRKLKAQVYSEHGAMEEPQVRNSAQGADI